MFTSRKPPSGFGLEGKEVGRRQGNVRSPRASQTKPKAMLSKATFLPFDLSSAQGCQHALPHAMCQPRPSGTQGRAESHTQPQVPVYTGTTSSRGDPQDHLFFPVIPTLSTARHFCLLQSQLLHHDVECASSAPSGCKLKLMGQNSTAVCNAPAGGLKS